MKIHRFWLLSTSAFLVLKSVLTCRAEETAEEGLVHMKQIVRNAFPNVSQLSTTNLSTWLADTNRVPPVLLDIRTIPEFKVSHLRGAWQVDPSAPPEDTVNKVPKGRAVVVYCSVGYRSSDFAAKVAKLGFTNVMNLEGSIFQWANEGRPLVKEGRPTTQVHPYNETFGKMLRPELRPEKWEEVK
ncbi:MAG TPA: rhodanese-like domain-containing protein [Candidatus Limnocylindria bacterium]|jgi:rhodanese-related sulfurtransferase|nr:rhodanese-like domain-containing protein [Candidatus Limnocylindria bacterium]